jgi:hypothetical protein
MVDFYFDDNRGFAWVKYEKDMTKLDLFKLEMFCNYLKNKKKAYEFLVTLETDCKIKYNNWKTEFSTIINNSHNSITGINITGLKSTKKIFYFKIYNYFKTSIHTEYFVSIEKLEKTYNTKLDVNNHQFKCFIGY